MKIFTVYIKPKAAIPIETATFIEEGFSLKAFLFHFFWVLYHRIWWAAALIFLVNSALSYANTRHFISEGTFLVLMAGLLTLVGFEAMDWYQSTLKRRGYILFDIVSGKDLEQAQQRFFDYYATQAELQKK